MPLAEMQESFARALFAGAPPGGLEAPPGIAADRRFAVYRNTVGASLRAALGRRFPVTARLVGPEFAAALFGEFVRRRPPDSPVLLRYGPGFPEFLESFPPVRSLPYLSDVARLELARGAAYHAADAAPAPAEALAAAATADPSALVFRLHPSLRVIASAHPVLTIWQMNQPGRTPRPVTDWRPEAVLVARADDRLLTEPLAPGEAAFVQHLARGASFASASAAGAAAAFDPVPTLARLIARGLVIGVAERHHGELP